MIFNQFEFLFLFLPVTLLLALFILAGAARLWFLTTASLFFYGLSGTEHAAVLVFDIIWVFAVSRLPGFQGNRGLLTAAISVPLLGLLYFKYSGFIADTISLGFLSDEAGGIGPFFSNIVLPAGISFFTFQLIAFSVDRFRGDVSADMDFKTFAAYISFFPQLVAGPIVRPSEVKDQFEGLGAYRLDFDTFSRGIGYVVIGLAMKVLIADTLGRYLEPMIDSPGDLTSLASLYVVLAYSFQIYFDFYGYSLVAIGLAMWFGIHLPDNFRRPYSSCNPKDFWRRWHVTLSYWIRDYLYLPLGGNRDYIRNIIITFAICGLWHGAAWTFVVWGLYHAILVGGYSLFGTGWDRLPRIVQIMMTFILVSLGWVLFIFDFTGTQQFFAALAGQGGNLQLIGLEQIVVLGVAAMVCFVLRAESFVAWSTASFRNAFAAGSMLGLVFFGSLLFVGISTSFIYFRF